MKYLPEVIRVLERFREPRIETVDIPFRRRKKDKGWALYEGIRTGQFQTDAAAAKSLYESGADDQRYFTIKSRLKRRTTNSLFHLNLKRAGMSPYAQAVQRIQKRACLAEILVGLGARGAGVRLAKQVIKEAREVSLTPHLVEMLALLRMNASLTIDQANFEKYDNELGAALQLLSNELLITGEQQRIALISSSRVVTDKDFIQHVTEVVSRMTQIVDHRSPNFEIELIRLRLIERRLHGDGIGRVHIASEALHFLESHPKISHPVRKGEFYREQADAYLSLRNYTEGRLAIERSLSAVAVGTNNWFIFNDRHMQLLLVTTHFVEARQLFVQITTHPRYETLPGSMTERWRIYEQYINFGLRNTTNEPEIRSTKKFDPHAFARDIPTAIKDKHGLQIAVIILHILTLMEENNYGAVADRIDALNAYATRHLRNRSNLRSGVFIRMLTMLEKNAFSYQYCKPKADRLFTRMMSLANEPPDSDLEMQVVPYEWLWDWIMNRLEEAEAKFR